MGGREGILKKKVKKDIRWRRRWTLTFLWFNLLRNHFRPKGGFSPLLIQHMLFWEELGRDCLEFWRIQYQASKQPPKQRLNKIHNQQFQINRTVKLTLQKGGLNNKRMIIQRKETNGSDFSPRSWFEYARPSILSLHQEGKGEGFHSGSISHFTTTTTKERTRTLCSKSA